MYIPKVLSPRSLIPTQTRSFLSQIDIPSPYSSIDVDPSSKTSRCYKYISQQQSAINLKAQTKIPSYSSNSESDILCFSSSNKKYLTNQQKICSLFEQLSILEQNSQRFNSSFRSVSSQVEHKIKAQNLNRQVLSNQIVEVRIDLKQRQKDIKLLVDMMGTKNKVSSNVDKSTDTQQSSRSSNSKINTFSRSIHKSKKHNNKIGLKIFNRV